jgi:hypothetical protein
LGAGASKDFGDSMPIGSTLAFNIEQQLNKEFSQSAPDGPIKTAIMRSPGGLSGAHATAATRIRASLFAQASIDDLLNEWRNDSPEMIEVGKVAIATAILEAERKSVLGPSASNDPDKGYQAIANLRDCWMAYLLRSLQPGFNRRELEQVFSNVGFIIFNYDRCIEQYLYWAFQNVAGMHAGNAALAVERIPIVHVYGSLGRLPYASGKPLDVAFGSETPVHGSVWKRIKTYTEEDHDANNLASIHALFRNAQTLVFLGMGFHDRNMELLFKGGTVRDDCKIWGTAQGLTPQRQAKLPTYFDHPARKAPQFENFGCREFLASYGSTILQGH